MPNRKVQNLANNRPTLKQKRKGWDHSYSGISGFEGGNTGKKTDAQSNPTTESTEPAGSFKPKIKAVRRKYRKYSSNQERLAARKLRLKRFNDAPTVCYHCGKTFLYKRLRGHLAKAIGKNVYPCQFCGKKFTKSSLRCHELRHKGEKNFKCNECDFACVTKSELIFHKSKHLSEKTFVCDQCGAKFKAERGLKNHVILHDNSKRVECSTCDYVTYSKYRLRRHMMQHDSSMQVKFNCEMCGLSYKKRQSLKEHLSKKHGVLWKPRDKVGRTLENDIEETIEKAKDFENFRNQTHSLATLPSDIFEAQEVEITEVAEMSTEAIQRQNHFPHSVGDAISFDNLPTYSQEPYE